MAKISGVFHFRELNSDGIRAYQKFYESNAETKEFVFTASETPADFTVEAESAESLTKLARLAVTIQNREPV